MSTDRDRLEEDLGEADQALEEAFATLRRTTAEESVGVDVGEAVLARVADAASPATEPARPGEVPARPVLRAEPRSATFGAEPRPATPRAEPRPATSRAEPRPATPRAEPRPATSRAEPRSGVLIRLRRWSPLLAAALVLLYFGREAAWAQPITIVAPGGALVWESGGWRRQKGELERRAPFRLRAEAEAVELVAEGWRAALGPHGELEVATADRLKSRAGGLSIDSRDDLTLEVDGREITTRGATRLAIARGEDRMRNKKLLALVGSAGALVILYAGVVHLGGEAHAEVLSGPSAAVLDAKGGVRRLGFGEAEGALLQPPAGTALGQDAEGASGDGLAHTGGFWNEATRSVHFSLAGEVFDAESGAPIESFETELVADSLKSFGATGNRTGRVDKATDGHFRLDGLGLGTYRLIVRAEGYAPSRQVVQLQSVTDDPYLVVPLSSGGSVSGVVVDWRGEPLEGAEVTLGGCSGKRCPKATSDARGGFLLDGAPEEAPFSLAASHPRYGEATLPNQRVEPGETLHVQLQLSGILEVHGRVLRGAQHAAVAGFVVRADDASTVTDQSGAYLLHVPLTERPKVRVVTGAALPVELASYPESRSAEPIRWVESETHVAELEKDFLLAMESATLTGRITDEHGAPVAGARLLFANSMGWSDRGHETFPEQTVTGADGTYRIDDIPAHAGYRVKLERGDERQVLGVVIIDEPEAVTADFSLSGGTVRGRFIERGTSQPFAMNERACSRFGAQSLGNAAVYLARCLDDGSFELEDLPPGRYQLGLMAPKLHKEVDIEPRMVEVPSAAPVDIFVTGKRFVGWTVRVTDAEGRFVPGVMLRYHFGRGSNTSSLDLEDDGTMRFSVPEDRVEVFFDAAGYASAQVDLSGRDAKQVVEVKLTRQ